MYQQCIDEANESDLAGSCMSWQTTRSFKIMREFVRHYVLDYVLSVSTKWDFFFLLDSYYAGDELLWISEGIPECRGRLRIGEALVTVALASVKPLSYALKIMENLAMPYRRIGGSFEPSTDWRLSALGTAEVHQRLRKFMWSDIFALTTELGNQTRTFVNSSLSKNRRQCATSIRSIVSLWDKYDELFSIEMLEKDQVSLLKWAVFYQETELSEALIPLYRGYVKTSKGRKAAADLLEDFTDIPEKLAQSLRAMQGDFTWTITPPSP